MLSPRLIRKFEGLNDEALAHLEAQADRLLAMPQHCRTGRTALHLVDPRAVFAASRRATTAALLTEQRQLTAEAQTWVTRSRHLVATIQATTPGKPRAAKVDPPRRRLAIVRRG